MHACSPVLSSALHAELGLVIHRAVLTCKHPARFELHKFARGRREVGQPPPEPLFDVQVVVLAQRDDRPVVVPVLFVVWGQVYGFERCARPWDVCKVDQTVGGPSWHLDVPVAWSGQLRPNIPLAHIAMLASAEVLVVLARAY